MTAVRRLLIDAEYPQLGPLHRWGERVTVRDTTPTGCPQGERTCARCGLVRVTVHPPGGFPWREWRPKDGPQIRLSTTPPCVGESEI